MKIFKRIKRGIYKGWTIRKSKHGWYDLYSSNGISQTSGKKTLDEIEKLIKKEQDGQKDKLDELIEWVNMEYPNFNLEDFNNKAKEIKGK